MMTLHLCSFRMTTRPRLALATLLTQMCQSMGLMLRKLLRVLLMQWVQMRARGIIFRLTFLRGDISKSFEQLRKLA